MDTSLITIGRAETIALPELGFFDVPARIDTGARTSSLWVSGLKEEDGKLSFTLFGGQSPLYTGETVQVSSYEQRTVASSNGVAEERYVVKLLVSLHGKKVRASFTLTDRSTQVYPVLIGRNILRGKFVVNVKLGKPLREAEKQRSKELQS